MNFPCSYALNNPLLYTDPTGWDPVYSWDDHFRGNEGVYYDDKTGDPWGWNDVLDWMGDEGGMCGWNSGGFWVNSPIQNSDELAGFVFGAATASWAGMASETDMFAMTNYFNQGYNSLRQTLYFTSGQSTQDGYNTGLWAYGGDGDGNRKFHFGISHDVNISMGPLGGTFEHGDIFSMPGNYHTYGHTLGFELSYSLNLVFMITKPNFQEKNFFGGAAELDFSTPLLPWSSLAFGGNNTSNLYNYLINKPLNSYTIIKFGIGFGGGVSITPNSRTKRNYFFYGDPNPRRIYWNPTSR